MRMGAVLLFIISLSAMVFAAPVPTRSTTSAVAISGSHMICSANGHCDIGGIKSAFHKLGQKIKHAFQKFGHAIKKAAQKVGHFLKTTGAKIAKVALKIVATVGKIVSKVVAFIPGVGKVLGKAIEGASEGINKASDAIHAHIGGKLGKAMERMDKAQHIVGKIP